MGVKRSGRRQDRGRKQIRGPSHADGSARQARNSIPRLPQDPYGFHVLENVASVPSMNRLLGSSTFSRSWTHVWLGGS